MKDKFWNVHRNFLSASPLDIVKSLFNDDKKNYSMAESKFSKEIALLDDALVLFISSLQGAYRSLDKWKDNTSTKASIAMANSTLNYILLARHAVLLGYFPECRNLLRSCHERITRSFLFYADINEAQKFLSGKQLSTKSEQSYVDNKLAKLLAADDGVLKILRAAYHFQSSNIHPNLESLSVRIAGPQSEKLSDRVAKYPMFGGLVSDDVGKLTIFSVIQVTLFASTMIGFISVETPGIYLKEYNRILRITMKSFAKLYNKNSTNPLS
ncbi:MAG: hypothetical protein ABR954_10480 [Dehalococcoidales bacterium]